jgi:hypothetical protein
MGVSASEDIGSVPTVKEAKLDVLGEEFLPPCKGGLGRLTPTPPNLQRMPPW